MQLEIEQQLFDIYAGPMHSYVRLLAHRYCGGPQAEEKASDWMQDIATHVLKNGVFQKWDPGRGGLRTYLKSCIRHHIADAIRREKKGIIQVPLAWGGSDAGEGHQFPDWNTPEKAFDREWGKGIIDRAEARLREYYENRGKGDFFERAKNYIVYDPANQSYAQWAKKSGASEGGALRRRMTELRKRFRKEIRQEIEETTGNRTDPDEELRHFLRHSTTDQLPLCRLPPKRATHYVDRWILLGKGRNDHDRET